MELKLTGVERWQSTEAASDATLAVSRAILPGAAPRTVPSAKRFTFLSAEGQRPTPLEQESLLGTNDLVETSFLDRCRLSMDCIGRVRFETPRGRGYATGFLVGPGLLMTNHHVFPEPDAARGAAIQFGYRYNIAGDLPAATEDFDLDPATFYVSDPDLDFCVVAIADASAAGPSAADRGYLRLIQDTGKAMPGDFVTIIQHPDGAAMQIALRENEVTRLEPDEPFLWYQADTAHGSSGAPVFNDTLQLVALHASGRIRRDAEGRYARRDGSWAVSLDGLQESDVIWDENVGFRVSRICASLLPLAQARSAEHAALLDAAMQGGDVLSAAVERAKSGSSEPERRMGERIMAGTGHSAGLSSATQTAAGVAQTGGSGIVIPLQLRVILETGAGLAVTQLAGAAPARTASALEAEAFAMRIPVIYDGLEHRPGFNHLFLDQEGEDAPMPRPTPTGEALLAPLLDGSGSELKYRHFSIWMHKDRRLPMFTASNVDWTARKSTVDGKKTDRKTLAGFPPGKTFAEQWVSDPRIDARHQIADIFYTEDRGAFDKGHIVRRDDVCWGSSFEEIQMANGDTYHVTNCSPQIKSFNQGPEGEENWGDLESHVQAATRRDAEKAIIYAGPIFDPADRWFSGKDDLGPTRIQIPSRFWKIVLVKGNKGLEAYGFILSQDVRPITEAEFYVTDEWIGALKPISEIGALLRGWVSLEDLASKDQFETVTGKERD
jgi:endonuclease G